MAPHSSVLAWRIPWTEEPAGLQSTGSQSQTRLKGLSTAHTCGITIPWPGTEPAPPALQGGFLTTGRPENPVYSFLKIHVGGEGLGRQEGGEEEPGGQASMPSGANRLSDGQRWASAAATALLATRGPGADNQEVPAFVT